MARVTAAKVLLPAARPPDGITPVRVASSLARAAEATEVDGREGWEGIESPPGPTTVLPALAVPVRVAPVVTFRGWPSAPRSLGDVGRVQVAGG